VFLHAGALAVGGALLPASAFAQQITTTDLGGGVFLLQGRGGNVIAMAGPDKERREGVPVDQDQGGLMIDGGRAVNADALLRQSNVRPAPPASTR
jgi:hypothetical protein